MAFDYDSNPTGIFRHLGPIAAQYHAERSAAQSIESDLSSINDALQDGGQFIAADSIPPLVAAWQDQHASRRSDLAALAEARLVDRDTMLVTLGVTDASVSSVLARLIEQMDVDGETIESSVVVVSLPDAADNVGDGRLLVTTLLDGRQSPASSVAVHRKYAGVLSELAHTEQHRFACTNDSYSGGTEGSEVFSWNGGPTNPQHGVLLPDGSGSLGSITVSSDGAQLLENSDFETFTSNVPDSWTLDNGVAGTNCLASTSIVFHGDSSLKLVGGVATVQVSQALPDSATSLGCYCVAVRVRADSGILLGDFVVELNGTNYTPTEATVEVQTVTISSSPTDGAYYLLWRGYSSSAIPWNATSAQVQTALRTIPGLDCVVVDTTAGVSPNFTHRVRFYGVTGNLEQLTSDETQLLGGSIAHATTTQGTDGDSINLPATALPTSSWATLHFFVVLPEAIPDDMKLVVRAENSLTATKAIYVDDLHFVPVNYQAGIGAVLLRGETPFAMGDSFTLDVTNTEGNFQRFFREAFNVQLPSSSSPTIDDALAS